jgi:hypothetical protein
MARKHCLTILLCFGLLFLVLPAAQANLLVSNGSPFSQYGYGHSYWDNMTAALQSACPQIDTADNFENLTQMLSYDALWLDIRPYTSLLSANELDNIAAFIATGRRVVLMGENHFWADWDNQILSLVVGVGWYSSEFTGIASPVISNALTSGVSFVDIYAGGKANGDGTALFNQNFATLWGDNVLTVLDANVFDDSHWNNQNNGIFAQNVAAWIGTPVPLPGAVWLLGSGLLGLGILGYRRKRH